MAKDLNCDQSAAFNDETVENSKLSFKNLERRENVDDDAEQKKTSLIVVSTSIVEMNRIVFRKVGQVRQEPDDPRDATLSVGAETFHPITLFRHQKIKTQDLADLNVL